MSIIIDQTISKELMAITEEKIDQWVYGTGLSLDKSIEKHFGIDHYHAVDLIDSEGVLVLDFSPFPGIPLGKKVQ